MLEKKSSVDDFVIGQPFWVYCNNCEAMKNTKLFGVCKDYLSFNCESCKDIIIYEKKVFGYK